MLLTQSLSRKDQCAHSWWIVEGSKDLLLDANNICIEHLIVGCISSLVITAKISTARPVPLRRSRVLLVELRHCFTSYDDDCQCVLLLVGMLVFMG